jgi:hypothetical protein
VKNLSRNSIKNGKKGGRPKVNSTVTAVTIQGINTVILTEHQCDTLIERYGILLFEKAITILEEWLNSSPCAIKYKGKNNYAHFRSDGWVINTAKKEIQPIPQT